MKKNRSVNNVFVKHFILFFVVPVAIILVGAFLWFPSFWAQPLPRANPVPLVQASIDKVNVNTSTVEELTVLPGIGEKKAQLIVKYRSEHGDFTKTEELLNIPGISKKILATLEPLIIC